MAWMNFFSVNFPRPNIFFVLRFCIPHHLLSFLLGRCIEKYLLREKKILGRLYFLINSLRVIVSWPLRCRCVWFRYCLYSRNPDKFPCNCSSRGFSGILGKFLRVNLHLFWYGGRGRVASEEGVGESQT